MHYANITTLHLMKKRLQIVGNNAHHVPGWLETCDENDVFILVGFIPNDEWQALLGYIQDHFPNKNVQFALAPGAAIEHENKATINMDDLNINPGAIIKTNDPDFHCQQLKAENKDIQILSISSTAEFKDIFALKEKHPDNGFSYQEYALIDDLKQEKDIVFNGDINSALYPYLLPLLMPNPMFDLNGERIPVKANISVVLPSDSSLQTDFFPCLTVNYTFNDYQSLIPKVDIPLFEKIKRFYHYAEQLPHRGNTMPSAPYKSFSRLTNMIYHIQQFPDLENPIKPIFHNDYLPHTEDYAYLNVIAKWIFATVEPKRKKEPYLQVDKLHCLIQEKSITNDNAYRLSWQLLNCCSATLLLTLFPDIKQLVKLKSNDNPEVQDKAWQTFMTHISPYIQGQATSSQVFIEKKSSTGLEQAAKDKQQLEYYIKNKRIRIIFLKGEPGVGKTYEARHLAEQMKLQYFEGEQALINCLTPNQQKQAKVFVGDEANRMPAGHWNFLSGLVNGEDIYHQGRYYPPTAELTVLVTGNFEYFPDRHFHPLFRNHAVILHYKLRKNDFLKLNIVKPILPQVITPQQERIMNDLLYIWHQARKHIPFLTISMRDLHHLTQRFVFIRQTKQKDVRKALFEAAQNEFYFTIQDKTQQSLFLCDMQEKFGVLQQHNAESDKVIPFVVEEPNTQKRLTLNLTKRQRQLVRTIVQFIEMRQFDKTQTTDKKILLIQGPSGIGKSKCVEMILLAMGFRHNHENPSMRYDKITPRGSDSDNIINQARMNGSLLLNDECNLGTDNEKWNSVQGDNPAYRMIATQNHIDLGANRKEQTKAELNRMQIIYFNQHDEEEWLQLIESYRVQEPEAFLEVIQEAFNDYPHTFNARTAFRALDKVAPRRVFSRFNANITANQQNPTFPWTLTLTVPREIMTIQPKQPSVTKHFLDFTLEKYNSPQYLDH